MQRGQVGIAAIGLALLIGLVALAPVPESLQPAVGSLVQLVGIAVQFMLWRLVVRDGDSGGKALLASFVIAAVAVATSSYASGFDRTPQSGLLVLSIGLPLASVILLGVGLLRSHLVADWIAWIPVGKAILYVTLTVGAVVAQSMITAAALADTPSAQWLQALAEPRYSYLVLRGLDVVFWLVLGLALLRAHGAQPSPTCPTSASSRRPGALDS